jgi:hypothetical protein
MFPVVGLTATFAGNTDKEAKVRGKAGGLIMVADISNVSPAAI